jgi:branched-chain amino acid transport system substrate-binding protein
VDDPSPRIQEFVAKFKKAYGGQVPDSLAAQAYDAAGMLFDAMKRAPELTGPAIRDALAATKNYRGVTGDITMDANRNATKAAVVLKIAHGGKYEFAGRVMPAGAEVQTPPVPVTTQTAPAEQPKK